MSVRDKYQELLDAARDQGVKDLQVREENNVLYVEGEAPNGDVKDQLWSIYDKIDPNYAGGDLILDVKVGNAVAGSKLKVVTQESNLNIRKGPGTDQPIVGKAAHNEEVTLISKPNDQWWLIRSVDGEEGYAYAQYLEPVE